MKNLALCTALAVTLAASPVWAKGSKMTTSFVHDAAIANQFEIDSSKLALQKSQNEDVKQFAQQMIDDHTKAGNEMKASLKASKTGIIAPTSLDMKHKDKLSDLKGTPAGNFDKAYIAMQADAHDKAVSLFSDYSSNGDNATLKDFATRTLPTLESHQQQVNDIKSKM